MAAHADANLHEPTKSETDFAAEIARAIHRRPLMDRLAKVASTHAGEQPENGSMHPGDPSSTPVLSPLTMPSQPVAAASSPEQAAYSTPIAGIQPRREQTLPPRSAEWLGKARRERNRARFKNALAWLSTVAIGGTIIATTMFVLQT